VLRHLVPPREEPARCRLAPLVRTDPARIDTTWRRSSAGGPGEHLAQDRFFAWYRGLAIGPMARVSQMQLVQPVLTLGWAWPSPCGPPCGAAPVCAEAPFP